MILDVFEHAYHIDYENDRARYVGAFWNMINLDEANKKLERTLT